MGRKKSDQELLEGIRSGVGEDDCLRFLYREHYPMIRSLIGRLNGSEEEARDIFQEGVITFYEQVKQNRYQARSSIKTYLYAICKNLWLNQLKRNRVVKTHRDASRTENPTPDTPLSLLLDQEKQSGIMKVLGNLGDSCRELLRYKLYQGMSMEEIAKKMGFKNEQIARNKHYKCKQELKRLIEADPVIKSLLPFIR